MSTTKEKKDTILMTFPVTAVHKTTVWASNEDDAERAVQNLKNDDWELVECNPNSIALHGLVDFEVLEDEA